MAPRSLAGQHASKMFTQQVADSRKDHDGQPPTKKFKTSAPKGTKLGSNYQDRSLARREEDSEDDKQKRLKALEEMYKLDQIDESTFEKLKSEIGIGGDLSSTHLVKGLDWKLLERIRRGEDLNSVPQDKAPEPDVDEELDHVLEREARHVSKDPEAPAEPATRDEILRRLKESRAARQGPPEPALGDRFKKVSSDKASKKKFVEVVNGRRREVLIVTNADGSTKRKTRWIDKEEVPQLGQPLGMEVPAEILAKQKALELQAAEEEDDDIFQGIDDYDPLAGIDESDGDDVAMPKVGRDENPSTSKPRNYFATSNQDEEPENQSDPFLKDPTLISALKRAAALQRREEDDKAESSKTAKHEKLLVQMKEQARADAADLDYGFGESRFGDDDDEGPVWDEDADKKPTRKRGGKKRKGDKDNVSDVMAVLQGRDKKG
jgi:hypothetical protein